MSSRFHTRNWILDALSDEEFKRLQKGMERVDLDDMETLFAPERPGSWVYFPSSGVISFLRGFRDGTQVEVGVVGREGMAGLHGFLGMGLEPLRAVVQHPGAAFRVDRRVLEEEFLRGEMLQRLLLRFTYALLSQISQTAACNQLHSIDERLARWLLAMSDRVDSDELPLSHEFLAHMLGTARARVTEAIGRFRSRGGLGGGRGQIIIQDRKMLELDACECYDEIRQSYAAAVKGALPADDTWFAETPA